MTKPRKSSARQPQSSQPEPRDIAEEDQDEDDLINQLLDKATTVLKQKHESGEIAKPKEGIKVMMGPSVRLGEDLVKQHPKKSVAEAQKQIAEQSEEATTKEKRDAETAGPKWFNMQATPMTPELERELQLLKMRSVLDPKRHYKRDSGKTIPQFFQVGTMVDSAQDFYSSRVPRKQKNKSTVDQLLQDQDRRQYFKQKFVGIQEKKSAGRQKHFKQTKQKRKRPQERE